MNSFCRFSLLCLTALTFVSTPLYGAIYVESLKDFQEHIDFHRSRVVVLGMALAEEHFPDLPKKELMEFLTLHDTSKTDAHNSEELFRFYGKGPVDQVGADRLKATVGKINAIDTALSHQYFLKHSNLTPAQQERFLMVEKIADLVDRSLDPVAAEEFGRCMTPASQFLKDPELARLSLWLEGRYQDLTPTLKTPSLRSCMKVFSRD